MKNQRHTTTRRFGAIGIVLGLVMAVALPLQAASFTWTNTANGTSGYWNNGVLWGQGGATPYPGSASSDAAYLTNNSAAGTYTDILNVGLGFAISTLVISNGDNGQAWLIVTNNAGATGVIMTNNTALVLSTGGRLQIDNGGAVTNTTGFSWYGTNGTVYLNQGGKLFTGGALTIGSGISNVNATVTSASGAGNGGIWDARNQTLTIGTGAATGNVLTITSGAVVSNVGVVNIGDTAGARGNGLSILNGAFFQSGAVNIGNAYGASNNFYNVGGGAAMVTVSNNGAIDVGNYVATTGGGNNNSMTVTNAKLWSNGLNIGNQYNAVQSASNNSVTVLANSTWDLLGGNVFVGSAGTNTLLQNLAYNNSLTVNGGVLTNLGVFVTIGGYPSGGNIAGAGNSLIVTNGGTVLLRDSTQMYIGYVAGASNTVKVSGPGSTLKAVASANTFVVGGGGPGNQLIIEDGGQVLYAAGSLQMQSSSNLVLVTGSTSVLSNGLNGGGGGAGYGVGIGALGASGNTVIISNGAKWLIGGGTGANDGQMILGSGVGSISNRIIVTGNGSVWSNYNAWGSILTIAAGNGGKYNSLTVADGGKYFANGAVTVGSGLYSGANSAVSNSFNIGSAGLPSAVVISNYYGSAGITVGGSANANYNTMTITNATVQIQSNGSGSSSVVGNGGSSNVVNIYAGGTWDFGGICSLSVGGASTAYGNSLNVYKGGLITNVSQIGMAGTNNTLLVANGGQAWAGTATLRYGGFGNTILVTDQGSMLNGGLLSVSDGASFIVSNGAKVSLTSLYPGYWDYNTTGQNGTLIVTGPGSQLTGTRLWPGLDSSSNLVIVADHAGLTVPDTILGGGGAGTFTGNTVIVTGGGVLTNTTASGDAIQMGQGGSFASKLIVTNGGRIVDLGGSITVGMGTSNNSVLVTGQGSAITNNAGITIGSTSPYNSLTIANGGVVINTTGVIGSGASSSSNTVTVTDPGSSWTNSSTLGLGNTAGSTSNRLVVANGGTAVIGGALTVGGASGANSNAVLVTSGGVLQANTLAIGATTTGNTISNAGGVYQFTQASPTITSRAAGDIAINGGTISFLGINNADVTNNLGNGALKSIAFSGANTFMLNSASNNASGQAYTFAATASPSNYVNLAMINGATAYRGGGVTIGATGSLLVSNTVASFSDVATNSGVAVLVGGATTFTGGLYNQGTVTNRDNTFNGALTMNNGTFVTAGAAAQTLNSAVSLPGNGTFDVAAAGLTLAAGAGGVGGITKLGAGNLVLPTADAYAGDTRPVAGAVVLGNSYAVSNSTVNLAAGDTGSLVFSNNGAYTLGGLKGADRNLTLTGSDGNPVALTVGNNGQNTTFGGGIGGGGSVTKVGNGILILTGTNAYSGDTYINGGQLVLASVQAELLSTLSNTVSGGLVFSNVTHFIIGGLAGSKDLALVTTSGSGIDLAVGGNGKSSTYSGVMSGSGSLTKQGGGTFELTGHNTFSGAVAVNAGELLVNGALAGGSPLTLSANTILAGSGTVGRVVGGAGQVSPGNSPGLLTVNQLDPSGGTGFEFEFTQLSPNFGNLGAIGNDVLRITNATPFTVALGLSNTVNLVVTAPLTAGVINYLRGGFYSDSGAMFDPTINGATYNLFIDDGGPLAFVHTVAETTPWGTGRILEIGVWGKMIPEPQVVMFWLTGAATLYAARRRMQRRK